MFLWLIPVNNQIQKFAPCTSNQPPTLSNGYVTPASADTATTFNYYVTYKDPEGDAPTTKSVYIDGSTHTMTKLTGDYTSGANFTYSTTLSEEDHNYYFYFDDGHAHTKRLPASGTFLGPIVGTTAPDIAVSPTSHDFGSVNVGFTSSPKAFTVSNTGGVLSIGSITLTGTDAAEFSIQNDECSGRTSAPPATCTVDVVFSPTSEGAKSANLSIPSNDLDTPLNVPLAGTAVGVNKPDLTPFEITWTPSSPGTSDNITVTLQVKNQGDTDAVAKFYTKLYVDDVEKGSWYTDSLTAGESAHASEDIGTLSAGDHKVKVVIDPTGIIDESDESNNIYSKTLTVFTGANIFDTGKPAKSYPSMMGTHEGTIIPSSDITISKLYTYPCTGTGGHTESIKLYENGTLKTSGAWNGYQSDWHNITLAPPVILRAGHTYDYTIVTGSYPQIIHAKSKDVTGGTITCDEFVDTNGKIYTDWIPAIKLLGRDAPTDYATSNWLHFGYDNSYTGYNPVESTISITNVAQLERKWGVGCDDPAYSTITSSPAIYNGTLYTRFKISPSYSKLHAYDARTGQMLWQFSKNNTGRTPQPVVSEDGIIFDMEGSYPTNLYAIDADTGTELWEAPIAFDIGFTETALVTVDEENNVVYLVDFGLRGEGKLFALDKQTGEIVWFKNKATDGVSFVGDYVLLNEGKMFAMVYTTNMDHMLRIDASSHDIEIIFDRPEPESYYDIKHYALCTDKLVVVFDNQYEPVKLLVAYDPDSPTIVWQKEYLEITGNIACNTTKNVIYVPTDPYLYALDVTTGEEVWKYMGYGEIYNPSVANGIVYFLSDTNMYAINEDTGERLFSYPLGKKAHKGAQVAICEGMLFFSGNCGTCDLYALGLPG